MKWLACIVVALIVLPLQGYAVFWYRGGGDFFSRAGFECTVIPAFIELVVIVVSAMHFERLYGSSVANPHSLMGQTLRKDTNQAPLTPSARAAWDGGFEDPGKASSQMGKDR